MSVRPPVFVRWLNAVRICAGSERAARLAALHFWRHDLKDRSKVVFVGRDVAKNRLAVSVAHEGRDGEIRDWETVSARPQSVKRLLKKVAARFSEVEVCYEAGPTRYGLYRPIMAFGFSCSVVARTLIPVRVAERTKTDRRDAMRLARRLRAGEITPIWVPDETHESIRDLVRAREVAAEDQRHKRQLISAFLLRHGRIYHRPKTWTMRYRRWLQRQSFDHPAQQMLLAERHAVERVAWLTTGFGERVPDRQWGPVVEALQSLRGVALVSAVTFVAEIGDVRRFENPRKLMAYPDLVPSAYSTGQTIKRGGITKAGNSRVRRTLVEGAWTYLFPARIGEKKPYVLQKLPPEIQDIAWKAQSRRTARYRRLSQRGKKKTVIPTAIARELSAFMWDIARRTMPVS